MRITSKTVHDINKKEDNFALRYVFTYPGIISRAELVPSHGASRRRLGDYAAGILLQCGALVMRKASASQARKRVNF